MYVPSAVCVQMPWSPAVGICVPWSSAGSSECSCPVNSLALPPSFFEALLDYSVGTLIVRCWVNLQVFWINIGLAITVLDGLAFNLDASLLGSGFYQVSIKVWKAQVWAMARVLRKLLLNEGKSSDSDKKLDIPLLLSSCI